jgi:hypothetical protein
MIWFRILKLYSSTALQNIIGGGPNSRIILNGEPQLSNIEISGAIFFPYHIFQMSQLDGMTLPDFPGKVKRI